MAVCSVTLRTSLSSLRRKEASGNNERHLVGRGRALRGCPLAALRSWRPLRAVGAAAPRAGGSLRGGGRTSGGRTSGRGGAVSATCAAGAHLPSFPPLSFLKIDAVEVTSAHSKKKKKGEQIGKDHLFVLLEAAPHGCRRWPFSSWGCHLGGWPGPCGALSACPPSTAAPVPAPPATQPASSPAEATLPSLPSPQITS